MLFYQLQQLYTGENHSVHPTFIDLTYVKPHKEIGSNLANWSVFSRWRTVIITPATINPAIMQIMENLYARVSAPNYLSVKSRYVCNASRDTSHDIP